MRVGLTVSIIGHAALLGFGFFAFPKAEPFEIDAMEALPVDLVKVSDLTDLAAGDKNAEKLPEEKPQPKPEVQAEAPTPKPVEKPAEKPVEVARPAEAPPPPPPPEPKPEPPKPPEPQQVAALPPPKEPEPPAPPPEPEPAPQAEPEPQPQPEAQAPAPPRVPKARPTPPKPVAQPKPTPPKPQRPVVKVQPGEEFNPDDIAALLNKQQPAGGGDPEPAATPQTLGSVDGHANAAMTQSEIEALKARLYQCWNPPVGVREAGNLQVTVEINLMQDGSLATPPQVVGTGFDPLWQVAVDSALRAVQMCAPFDMLPPEKYSLWRDIEFTFDPREMMGG